MMKMVSSASPHRHTESRPLQGCSVPVVAQRNKNTYGPRDYIGTRLLTTIYAQRYSAVLLLVDVDP